MERQISQSGQGFQFPGTFEISAMGAADQDLPTVLPQLLIDAGIDVVHESVRSKRSAGGNYVSVRISFRAATRAQYEAAHAALRAHPEVKWTL